jgi:hypothetical protein
MLAAIPEIEFSAVVIAAIAELRRGVDEGSTLSCVNALIAAEIRASKDEFASSDPTKSCTRSK